MRTSQIQMPKFDTLLEVGRIIIVFNKEAALVESKSVKIKMKICKLTDYESIKQQ